MRVNLFRQGKAVFISSLGDRPRKVICEDAFTCANEACKDAHVRVVESDGTITPQWRKGISVFFLPRMNVFDLHIHEVHILSTFDRYALLRKTSLKVSRFFFSFCVSDAVVAMAYVDSDAAHTSSKHSADLTTDICSVLRDFASPDLKACLDGQTAIPTALLCRTGRNTKQGHFFTALLTPPTSASASASQWVKHDDGQPALILTDDTVGDVQRTAVGALFTLAKPSK